METVTYYRSMGVAWALLLHVALPLPWLLGFGRRLVQWRAVRWGLYAAAVVYLAWVLPGVGRAFFELPVLSANLGPGWHTSAGAEANVWWVLGWVLVEYVLLVGWRRAVSMRDATPR